MFEQALDEYFGGHRDENTLDLIQADRATSDSDYR